MLPFLNLCDRGLSLLLQALVLVTSAVVTLALVILVICRYFFDISLAGMHEGSLFAAMWLYMCGAILASRKGEHLVVDFLATSLKTARWKLLHALMIAVLTLIIALFFSQWIYSMFMWGMKRPQIIPVLNVPLWWAQVPMAMMAVCGVIYALRDIARAVIGLNSLKGGL